MRYLESLGLRSGIGKEQGDHAFQVDASQKSLNGITVCCSMRTLDRVVQVASTRSRWIMAMHDPHMIRGVGMTGGRTGLGVGLGLKLTLNGALGGNARGNGGECGGI